MPVYIRVTNRAKFTELALLNDIKRWRPWARHIEYVRSDILSSTGVI